MWVSVAKGWWDTVDCAALTGCADCRSSSPPALQRTILGFGLGSFRNALNNQLRTGADKGNPTV